VDEVTEKPKYYYAIKRFKDEPLLVTPSIAMKIARAKAEGKESVIFKHEGEDMLLDCRAISAVEETRQLIPKSNVYLLEEGENLGGPPEPILNMAGAVITNWYKKPVSGKEWNSYYSKMASYKLLAQEGGVHWIAWRKPMVKNDPHQEQPGTVPCTKEESERLWAAEARSNGR